MTTQTTQSAAQKPLGTSFGYQAFYLLIRGGGRRAAYALLYFVVGFYVLCRPQVRESCRPYVQHRFPASGADALWWHSYRMVLAFGKVLVDRAVVGMLGPDRYRVTLEGREQLLQIRNQRQGMILMMSHVGCWQVAMSALNFLEEPVHMLMHHDSDSLERHYYEYAEQECPYRTIDPRGYLGGALEMLGVLKQGQILAVMGDRLPPQERNSVTVDFLGGKVAIPFSPFQLASATGAPVVVMLTRKCSADHYEMVLADVIEVPSGLGRKAESFVPYAQRYADILAGYCRDNPYQFFNFFDMWQ
ncbi:MAG: lysophospholipid acyltransferase family protein [Desulfuromonas sp.]|nr:lysophospholipid acyltransferase family protein [Desulfuromonas sp.]